MASVMTPECAGFSHTEQVVVYMALPLFDKGYTRFMDNWYSTCCLYNYLNHRKTTACGAMLSNTAPLPVHQSKPTLGQSTAFWHGPMLCFKFKDKKDIYILTACHNETTVKPPCSHGWLRTKQDTEHCGLQREHGSCWPTGCCSATILGCSQINEVVQETRLSLAADGSAECSHSVHEVRRRSDITAVQSWCYCRPDVIWWCDVYRKGGVCSLADWSSFLQKLQATATWTKPQAQCRVCYKDVTCQLSVQSVHKNLDCVQYHALNRHTGTLNSGPWTLLLGINGCIAAFFQRNCVHVLLSRHSWYVGVHTHV